MKILSIATYDIDEKGVKKKLGPDGPGGSRDAYPHLHRRRTLRDGQGQRARGKVITIVSYALLGGENIR